jgi:hypothetical protein
MNIDYSKVETPWEYRCSICDASGIKLWKHQAEYNPKPICCVCVSLEEELDITGIREDGSMMTYSGIKTHQIGNYVPAVPSSEVVGFWGYGNIPAKELMWWLKLPISSIKRDKATLAMKNWLLSKGYSQEDLHLTTFRSKEYQKYPGLFLYFVSIKSIDGYVSYILKINARPEEPMVFDVTRTGD